MENVYGSSNKCDSKKKREVVVTNEEMAEGTKERQKTYLIPYGSRLKVTDGQVIEAGAEITEGSVNPHDIMKIRGIRAVQDYLLREVQRVYRLQGVEINDKHIEVIVRQMLKKVRIEKQGDTDFLPGSYADFLEFEDMNEKLVAEGKEPAEGVRIVLGITKAALATDSFLSAASFQETTKVLTDAAIKGRIDPLIGLKENVIIGQLIPAGTGLRRYRDVKLDTDARIEEKAALEKEKAEEEARKKAETAKDEAEEDAEDTAEGAEDIADEDLVEDTDSAEDVFDEEETSGEE
jgi:DNA-directed RNA polymerase subunit beta'